MIKPRALRPGDGVAVVSPASSFDRDEFDRGVAEIRRLGYEPIYDDYEIVKLADGLTFLCAELGYEHPLVKQVLAGKSPAAISL